MPPGHSKMIMGNGYQVHILEQWPGRSFLETAKKRTLATNTRNRGNNGNYPTVNQSPYLPKGSGLEGFRPRE